MSSHSQRSYFPALPPASAPAASHDALARLQASVGGVPNLAAAMAASPALIDGFVTLRALFQQHSTFTAPEREIVSLCNAVENGCGYCTAIHSAFGSKAGLTTEAIDAVRQGQTPADARLAALVGFNRELNRRRGRVGDAEIEAFMLAGFTTAQALELIAAAAISTLANYAGRLTGAPLDEFLLPHRMTAQAET
jgi:uncharacterized peroxidase-related enzyme